MRMRSTRCRKRTEETVHFYMLCNMFLISLGFEHFFFLYVFHICLHFAGESDERGFVLCSCNTVTCFCLNICSSFVVFDLEFLKK